MTSDMLSQDEIDALLKQNNLADEETEVEETDESIDNVLSSIEQDALGEIGNISFGSASTTLSTLLNQKVDITTPRISLIHVDRLKEEFPDEHVAINVNYTEGFEGKNLLVIRSEDASIIADLMMGGDGSNKQELSELHISAVQEAMNQMMGTAATSMSTIFNKRVDISPPGIHDLGQDKAYSADNYLVTVSFRLKVGELIDSNIMQIIPLAFAKSMINSLLGQENEPQQPIISGNDYPSIEDLPDLDFEEPPQVNIPASAQTKQPEYQQQPQMQQRAYQEERNVVEDRRVASNNVSQRAVNVQPAQFSSFDAGNAAYNEPQNLDLLLDIPLQVTVELGRTKRVIRDILELSPGSILELDKLAGEPVDILVNNKLIAKGEVVVIEENFGVRVTDILSPSDRLRKLK